MNKKKIILIAALAAVAVGGSLWLFSGSSAKHKVTYVTATVNKGEISESVTATGTIEPVTEVEVGTQVSGIIDKIYVDYNSVVTKGQLIAEMDRVTLQSELASQRAAYNGAKAEYEYQQKNYERNKGLHEKQLISDTDYEQSLYNYQKAKSSYESSQASLAKAEPEEIEAIVRPCGLGRSKARDISACMRILHENYNDNIPTTFEELLKLPGVGRKSANLIMGDVFGKPAIVTDTHCIRLCNRIGLVDGIKDPKKVEMALWKIIPPEEGSDFCHRLVYHGREVCTARTKPYCDKCCLEDICQKNI